MLAADTVSTFRTDPESDPGSACKATTPLLNKATTPTTATPPPTSSDSSSSSPNGTDIAPTQVSAPLWVSNNPDSRVAFVTSVDVETPSGADEDVMADDNHLSPTLKLEVIPSHENTDASEICERFDSCNP